MSFKKFTKAIIARGKLEESRTFRLWHTKQAQQARMGTNRSGCILTRAHVYNRTRVPYTRFAPTHVRMSIREPTCLRLDLCARPNITRRFTDARERASTFVISGREVILPGGTREDTWRVYAGSTDGLRDSLGQPIHAVRLSKGDLSLCTSGLGDSSFSAP